MNPILTGILALGPTLVLLFIDALMDGDLLGPIWCLFDRHRFFYVIGGYPGSDSYVPTPRCERCGEKNLHYVEPEHRPTGKLPKKMFRAEERVRRPRTKRESLVLQVIEGGRSERQELPQVQEKSSH